MGFGSSTAQPPTKPVLAPGATNAIGDGTTPPAAPDAVLAASQAALAGTQAAARARKRAFSSGDSPATGTPGAATPGLVRQPNALGGGIFTSMRKF